MPEDRDHRKPGVVIVGAGFAGLNCALQLSRDPRVDVTIVDRRNHHVFQPLLYQVALAALSPAEIASPIRQIVCKANVLMDEVTGFDLERRRLLVRNSSLEYDYLVVAAGSTHSYFGHEDWSRNAPGLKSLEDALEIRRRVLLAFELAEREYLENGVSTPIQFVVVGGGPTGVELAGSISDIARMFLKPGYRDLPIENPRVLLVEGGPRVLPDFAEDLSLSAKRQLEQLGVEVRTGTRVTDIQPGYIRAGEEIIPSTVTLWAAGVAAPGLGKMLGQTDRHGRVVVDEYMNVPGRREVFVLGDLAAFTQDGAPLPGLAPVAIQMGKAAARSILDDVGRRPRKPFRYFDKGTMATIGRRKGIAQIRHLHLSGTIAWLAWLFVHITFLIGFRNRFLVLSEWAWEYFMYTRSAPLITGDQNLPGWKAPLPANSPAGVSEQARQKPA